jgi:5'-nucleotidase
MSLNRRTFIRNAAGASFFIGSGLWSTDSFGSAVGYQLTVLHTNDVHSRIDPFPMNDPKFPGMGGFARRAEVIRKIRSTEKNVLLLDAGDIFQGTPYFNLFNGEPEIRLMREMGYDASAIGNHDFDGGMENLAVRISEAGFPFLCANYDLSNSPLHRSTLPYKIFNKGGIKIGVFGLGIEPKGLIDTQVSNLIYYSDPVAVATKFSRILRDEERCDLVICLSHLGYNYKEKKVSDTQIAQQVSGIDLIIGGHTHTFLDEPVVLQNPIGKNVLVAQAGWAGIRLGRIDFFFDEKRRKSGTFTLSENISKKTIAR